MERYISQKGKIKKWEVPVGIFLALLFVSALSSEVESVGDLSSFMSLLVAAAIFGLPMFLIFRGVYYKAKARVISRALEHEKNECVSFETIETRTGLKEVEKILYTLSSMGYMQNVIFDFRENQLELEDVKRSSGAYTAFRNNYNDSNAYQTRSSFGTRSMGGDAAFGEAGLRSVTCPHCGATLHVPAGGSVVCEYCDSVVTDTSAGSSSSGNYSYGSGHTTSSASSASSDFAFSGSSSSSYESFGSGSGTDSSGSSSSYSYTGSAFTPSSGSGLKPKNKWVSLCLCFFFGIFGVHKFYEGKILMGIVYILTLGLFTIGVFADLLLILLKPNPYYV